jgi:ADP-ribosylation factor-like protein 6
MGLLDSFIEWLGFGRREVNVLVVGLDNSGKSSILNYLRPRDSQAFETVPTIGFNVENFTCKGLSFSAFDMSGQARYRTLWSNYYRTTHGIIFVVDSSDRTRIVVAHEELQQLLSHSDIRSRSIPILFLANKMDVRDALSDVGVSSALNLNEITNKSWHICSTNALQGDGIRDGIDWLSSSIKTSLDQAKR